MNTWCNQNRVKRARNNQSRETAGAVSCLVCLVYRHLFWFDILRSEIRDNPEIHLERFWKWIPCHFKLPLLIPPVGTASIWKVWEYGPPILQGPRSKQTVTVCLMVQERHAKEGCGKGGQRLLLCRPNDLSLIPRIYRGRKDSQKLSSELHLCTMEHVYLHPHINHIDTSTIRTNKTDTLKVKSRRKGL